MSARKPWACPKCDRVWSPTMTECKPCNNSLSNRIEPGQRQLLGKVIFPNFADTPTFKGKPWKLSERALARIDEIARHSNWPFRR